MSGHFFFADRYFGFDDGIYAACRLVEIVSRLDHPLSEELADLPDDLQHAGNPRGLPRRCEVQPGGQGQGRASRRRAAETIDLDGVRVKFEDGWGLVRASNTQPTLVLRFEADPRPKP